MLNKTVDSLVLKKNSSTPQFANLEKRAETQTDEARIETKKAANIAAKKNIKAEKCHSTIQSPSHFIIG